MNDVKAPINLEVFQGHIILLCKGWYKMPSKTTFFEALRMLWAIRCGYDYEQTSKDTLTYIANDMYSIISKCLPHKLPQLMDNLHRRINWSISNPNDMLPIEAIIWEYRSIISNLEVKRKINENWVYIINLPKPKQRILKKIFRGNGKYIDYYLIKQK